MGGGWCGGIDGEEDGGGIDRVRGDAFAGRGEELGELVAGAKAGEFDGGGAGVGAQKMMGEVEDTDWCAGIGQKKRGVGCCVERGEDGVDGAVERDEEAVSFGVGNGEGVVVGDLIEEERKNAALGADDVAEPDSGEAGGVLACDAAFGVGVGSEKDELGDALGGSHNAEGVNGLVGGDEDELAGVVRDGGLSEGEGAESVVFYRGEGVLFHERNMLESGGVEDDLRAMAREEV